MSSPLHNDLERQRAELSRRREAAAGIQRDLDTVRTTVTARSRALSVTVDSRGELLEINFRARVYRTMPAAELSNLIVETLKTAREQARATVVERFRPVLPPGLPLADMMNGKVDFAAMMRDALRFTEEERHA